MTSFPASIYARTDPIPALMSDTPTHSDIHGADGDEIEAIEGTLGVNPQGAFATVAARFTRMAVDLSGTTGALGAGASLDVPFTTEGFDTHGYHSGSATTATIPSGRGGFYGIGWRATSGVALAFAAPIIVKINGANTFVAYIAVGVGDMSTAQFYPLAAGDTVGLRITNNEAGATSFNASLTLVRLGD